jgi:hypothetical protein
LFCAMAGATCQPIMLAINAATTAILILFTADLPSGSLVSCCVALQ